MSSWKYLWQTVVCCVFCIFAPIKFGIVGYVAMAWGALMIIMSDVIALKNKQGLFTRLLLSLFNGLLASLFIGVATFNIIGGLGGAIALIVGVVISIFSIVVLGNVDEFQNEVYASGMMSTDRNSKRYGTRFITSSDMESEDLLPIQAMKFHIKPEDLVAGALRQIEDSICLLKGSSKYKPVCIKTIGCKTLLSNAVDENSLDEFYTLGVECNASMSRVVGALKFNVVGNSISVALEQKETISFAKDFFPAVISALFPDGDKLEKDENGRPRFGVMAVLAMCATLFLGWSLGSAMAGPTGGVIIAIALTIVFMMIATSMRKSKEKQKKSLMNSCKIALIQAYQSVDIAKIISDTAKNNHSNKEKPTFTQGEKSHQSSPQMGNTWQGRE